jgi:hypothetical protein
MYNVFEPWRRQLEPFATRNLFAPTCVSIESMAFPSIKISRRRIFGKMVSALVKIATPCIVKFWQISTAFDAFNLKFVCSLTEIVLKCKLTDIPSIAMTDYPLADNISNELVESEIASSSAPENLISEQFWRMNTPP